MKKVSIPLSLAVIFACKQEPKDYVTLNGKISNPDDSKTLIVYRGKDYKKEINLKDDGTFKDTLKIEDGVYSFKHGDEYGKIYLKNDNESSFTLDYNKFDETLQFKGDASDKNNFFVQNSLLTEKHLTIDIFDLTENEFNNVIVDLKSNFEGLKLEFKNLDASFFFDENEKLEKKIKSYEDYYQSKLAMRKEFPTGSPSPVFNDYENHKGGTTSLSDLKGKYIYVDIWATWCGPCKREIPYLKKLEESYKDKNITFVSISIDNGRGYRADTKEEAFKLSKAGWKKMVEEKELTGVQLFSDKAWQSDFIKAYKIKGIPRFILIDPDGKVVNADAPRPSSQSLVKLFNSLNI